jgi:pyruvate kinase
MQKLTKIIATIGPSTESEEMIEKLILEGVNIFRFNFKHNTVEWHDERIARVNKVAKQKLGRPVGTLIDLQGPEIRINMPVDQIEIKHDELLLFGEESFEKKEKGFSISHPDIIEHLHQGQKLLAEDGAFTFYVQKKDGKTYLKSASQGILKHRKSLNIPGADFPFPVLVDRDFEGLKLAERNEVDYVALSFVRSADDLRVVRKEMKKFGFKARMVAKIETQRALDDIEDIIEEADAIMIARGDLGVELPVEQVPFYQKLLIKKCVEKGKPVITATQMLQSMVSNPFPTRAEVSDVANACYDMTDAVMLSGETANGEYPLETVKVMKNTIVFNETKFTIDIRNKYDIVPQQVNAVIAEAAYNIYLKLQQEGSKVAGFVVFTHTGKTAQLVSQYRPLLPIYTFTKSERICDELMLYFGVHPYVLDMAAKDEVQKEAILKGITELEVKKLVKKGDKLIIIHGDKWNQEGATSTVKVVTVV